MPEAQTNTILIVEDDPGTAHLQRRHLERVGYAVQSAETVEQALATLRRLKIDLILLDYLLQGPLTGLDALKHFTEAGFSPPVIVVTGFNDPAAAVAALRAGVRDFIIKSDDYLERLPEAVGRVLGRARVERQLAESEAFLSAIVNSAKDAIITVEMDRRITFFNPAAERMFGVPARDAAGQPLRRFIPQEYIKESGAEPPEPGMVTVKLREGNMGVRANGELFPLEKSVSRIEVGGRKFYAILVRDVSERQRAERELLEREERFRSLSACSPLGIFLTDPQGRLSYVNPRFEAITGVMERDALGDGWTRALFAEDRRDVLKDWYTAVARGQGYAREFRLRPRPGEVRWASAKAVPMFASGGALTGYVGTVEDITERVHAEKKLREHATLLDKATDAILVRDLQDRILYWNVAAARLYGWSEGEAIARAAAGLIDSGPAEELEQARKAVLEQGEWSGELRQRARDGRELTVLSRWALVRDERGNPSSVLEINTDVTERKRLEAQLHRSQRLESIGVLAGGIAHDLNNMLTPILIAAELLRERVADPESQALLATLQASTERGAELVKQVLTFARGTEGQRQALPLPPIVKELGRLLTQTFPKSIAVTADVPRDLWLVAADATQVHQVLMNLCVNARDAMPHGGRLTIAARNSTPGAEELHANPDARPGPYVVLSVADTGTGIPPETLERIYDPFFTTKEPGKGTGLGLSTVRGIVRSNGGFLRVASQVGKGSAFEVYLPALTETLARAEEAQARPAPTASHGETVLVVDDEASIRAVAKTILEANGYRVLAAANGAEALALYEVHRLEISAVLTDMAMPIMDGPATIAALYRHDPGLPVIATSGNTGAEVLEKYPNVRALLPKPYPVDNLLTTLREVLDAAKGPPL